MAVSIESVSVTDLALEDGLSDALIGLNNAHIQDLSWLEPEGLGRLVGQAFWAGRIGAVEAFILALDQDADYASPNFLWFRERLRRFVYVDRIVVAGQARGRGHARSLYLDLFERALQAGHDQVVCEVNSKPPNSASDALHAGLGFSAVGEAEIWDGAKTVRYYARPLNDGLHSTDHRAP